MPLALSQVLLSCLPHCSTPNRHAFLAALSNWHLFKIYLFQREKERAQAEGAEGGGRSRLPLSKEPDVGLDPRILGSSPEPKSDA